MKNKLTKHKRAIESAAKPMLHHCQSAGRGDFQSTCVRKRTSGMARTRFSSMVGPPADPTNTNWKRFGAPVDGGWSLVRKSDHVAARRLYKGRLRKDIEMALLSSSRTHNRKSIGYENSYVYRHRHTFPPSRRVVGTDHGHSD